MLRIVRKSHGYLLLAHPHLPWGAVLQAVGGHIIDAAGGGQMLASSETADIARWHTASEARRLYDALVAETAGLPFDFRRRSEGLSDDAVDCALLRDDRLD